MDFRMFFHGYVDPFKVLDKKSMNAHKKRSGLDAVIQFPLHPIQGRNRYTLSKAEIYQPGFL